MVIMNTSCKSDELDVIGKCFGIKIIKRPKGQSDLIRLYIEDDETYYFKCSFAAYWLNDLSKIIDEAKQKADTEIIMKY